LACEKIAELTGKPIYRNDFTIYLTTFFRGPYNYDQGYLLIMISWFDPIMIFMHELLHFQFNHYWAKPGSEIAE